MNEGWKYDTVEIKAFLVGWWGSVRLCSHGWNT